MCYDAVLTLVEQRIVWAAQRGKQTWNRMKSRWERASSKMRFLDCRPLARDDFVKIRWGCNSWTRGRMIEIKSTSSSSDDSLLNECKNGIIAHRVREIWRCLKSPKNQIFLSTQGTYRSTGRYMVDLDRDIDDQVMKKFWPKKISWVGTHKIFDRKSKFLVCWNRWLVVEGHHEKSWKWVSHSF